MATQKRVESRFAEAAEKTTAILQELQLRLGREPMHSSAAETSAVETSDDLAHQLQQYFGATSPSPPITDASIPDELREAVINRVVDRILEVWPDPEGRLSETLKEQVMERLMERVLERLK